MSVRVDSKIVGWNIIKDVKESNPTPALPAKLPDRPHAIKGTTYKIKTPVYEEAIYLTINDIETPYGPRPFEMFIVSRVMESFQWITLCTRLVSAIFRHQVHQEKYDMFIIDEFMQTFDPGKQYWAQGEFKGKYMNSVVMELGYVLRRHCEQLGLLEGKVVPVEKPPQVEELHVDEDRMLQETVKYDPSINLENVEPEYDEGIPGALHCYRCNAKAMISRDGCLTCLECGESKCG